MVHFPEPFSMLGRSVWGRHSRLHTALLSFFSNNSLLGPHQQPQERGEDASAYVEKGDMVKKVKELAAKGPVVAEGSKAPGAFQAPPGFAFDPTSGQFYSTEHNMYFDTSSGCYYRGSQWFTFNAAAGQFVPWR